MYRFIAYTLGGIAVLTISVFAGAALDLTIQDRFGNPVKPREWFLVPIAAIDEVVTRIRDGSITSYIYDPKQARLVSA